MTIQVSGGSETPTLHAEITVTNVNESGSITGDASIDFAENSTGTAETYSITDPEGDSITWSISGTDAARFSISRSGALTFKSAPDYEKPNDGDKKNDYEVTISASDGNLTATLDVEVTVTNVNESGEISGSASITYAENGTGTIETYSIADPDSDSISWSLSGTDSARFSISSAGVLTFKSAPDYEKPNDGDKKNDYEVTINASDGSLTATLDVEITVTNVNESGAISGSASINYAENGTGTIETYSITDPDGDSITWSLAGTDAARFSISTAGALTFKSVPDYEKPSDGDKKNDYEVTISASDGNLTATLDVEITVTNVNESGAISGSASINYAENGTSTVGSYAVTDPEGDSVTWSISGTDAARFSISSAGALTFKSAPNYEKPNDGDKKNDYEVTVRASDGSLTVTLDVEITVTNVNESGAISGSTSINYAENDTGTIETYSITDPEGDSITWSISGTDAARFSMSSSGALTFKSVPDYEKPNDGDKKNDYEITIQASDASLTATLDVEINVTNVNESGTISGSTSISFAENGTGTVETYSITDPESDTITWSLSGTDAARFSISSSGALTFKSAPDFEKPNDGDKKNDYEVTVSASDGSLTSTLAVEITVTNVNEAGTISGSASINYAENGTGTVETFSITDPEGDSITWSISGTDAARFSISSSGVLTFKSAPDYEKPNDGDKKNDYEITIRASDGNLTATLDVEITVTNVNESGAISGSASINYAENGTGTVETYSITDPDGDSISWSLSGTDAARFSISSSGALTFKSAPDFEKPNDADKRNDYEVTVSASDGSLSATLYVEITVTNVNESGAISGSASVNYAENGAGTVETYSITDPDSDSISWSLSGTDAARFSISSAGELAFKSAPDFEKPNDGDKKNDYEVTISASDGNLTATLAVEVIVTDVNESGAISGSTSINYAENGTGTVETYSISDPESDSVTWSLAGTDAARFSISTAGALTFKSAPDYEKPNDGDKKNDYEVTINASDGSLTTTLSVEVTVTNVNEAGAISGSASINFAENGTGTIETYAITDPESDTVTWSVTGTDAARFSISSSGKLTFKSAPDYEKPNDGDKKNDYEVTISASDGSLTATLDVEITVTNVNEAGTISGSASINFAENGTGTIETYSITDPDSDSISWSLSGTDAARFAISSSGALTFKSAPDYEKPNDGDKKNDYEVTIHASDGNLPSTLDVEITVTNVNEVGSISGSASIDYAENGTGTVETYSITDPEADSVTWSLEGTDAARFSISSSGALTFKSAPDFEKPNDGDKDNVYDVTIQVSGGSETPTLHVEISITNVNELGSITGDASIDFAENSIGIAETYSITDPEGDSITWSLAGADAASFSLSADGKLTFKSAPDHEKPNDADKKNDYEVIIQASDGSLTSTLDVKITVTNVNELGSITGSTHVIYTENETTAVGTYSLSGAPEEANVTWSLGGVDASVFTIDTEGVLTFLRSPNFESPLDVDADNTYDVHIVAAVGQEQATAPISVSVTDAEDAPRFPLRAVAASIPENSCPGAHTIYHGIGGPNGTNTDEDGDPLTYVLSGPDASVFVIHPPTGHVTLAPGFPLDFEGTTTTYTLRVGVSDGKDTQGNREAGFVADDYLDLTVDVSDVNEPPMFIDTAGIRDACGRLIGFDPAQIRRSVVSGTPGGSVIGEPVVAADSEGSSLAYRIVSQSDDGAFVIDSLSGQLALAQDFSPTDARRVYTVRVSVGDGTTESTIEVRIAVETAPAPSPTPEPVVDIPDSPPIDSTPEPTPVAPPPAQSAAAATADESPASSGPSRDVSSVLSMPPQQVIEASFTPVADATQVEHFGGAAVSSASGRVQLHAPSGAMAIPYQVKLNEDDDNCPDLQNSGLMTGCVSVSIELFDESGEDLGPRSLNRPATLEIVVQTPSANIGGNVAAYSPTTPFDSIRVLTRPGSLAEWIPVRFAVRSSDDDSITVVVEARTSGQYAVVLTHSPLAREPSQTSSTAEDMMQPDSPIMSPVVVIAAPEPPTQTPVSFVNHAKTSAPVGHDLVLANSSSPADRVGSLLLALLIDVTIVLSAAAILYRL